MHHPVLLKSAIDGLAVKPNGLYIDGTFGEGGHSLEILKRGGRVLGIDWDEDQIKYQRSTPIQSGSNIKDKNLTLVVGNFAEIEKIAKENNFFPVDGIIVDLGLSMRQISQSGRGFSYQNPSETLDMRISLDNDLTAEQIISRYSQPELYEVFAKNSEEINSRAVAGYIVHTRHIKPIKTVGDLNQLLERIVGKDDKQVKARIYQGLRIAVNHEFENLKSFLKQAIKLLKKDGRLVVITFHSVEDRIVKNFIRENHLLQVNKKAIRSLEEKKYERSAKLRIISQL